MTLLSQRDQTRISARCLPRRDNPMPEGIKTQADLARHMREEAIGKDPIEGTLKRGRTEANKALDDKIAALMADGRERTVSEMADRLGLAQASVGRRLKDSRRYVVDYASGVGIWRVKGAAG